MWVSSLPPLPSSQYTTQSNNFVRPETPRHAALQVHQYTCNTVQPMTFSQVHPGHFTRKPKRWDWILTQSIELQLPKGSSVCKNGELFASVSFCYCVLTKPSCLYQKLHLLGQMPPVAQFPLSSGVWGDYLKVRTIPAVVSWQQIKREKGRVSRSCKQLIHHVLPEQNEAQSATVMLVGVVLLSRQPLGWNSVPEIRTISMIQNQKRKKDESKWLPEH